MNVNEAQKIWKEVSTTINAIHKLYIQISDELDNKKAKRMADLEMNFQRGIFEAAFEKNIRKKSRRQSFKTVWQHELCYCPLEKVYYYIPNIILKNEFF